LSVGMHTHLIIKPIDCILCACIYFTLGPIRQLQLQTSDPSKFGVCNLYKSYCKAGSKAKATSLIKLLYLVAVLRYWLCTSLHIAMRTTYSKQVYIIVINCALDHEEHAAETQAPSLRSPSQTRPAPRPQHHPCSPKHQTCSPTAAALIPSGAPTG